MLYRKFGVTIFTLQCALVSLPFFVACGRLLTNIHKESVRKKKKKEKEKLLLFE